MQDDNETAPGKTGRLDQLRDKLSRAKRSSTALVVAEPDGELFFEQGGLSRDELGRVQSLVAIACLFDAEGSTSVVMDTPDGICRAVTLASGRIIADPSAATSSRAQFQELADELITELSRRQESA